MRKVKLVFASFVVVCMLIVKLKMRHERDITGSQDSAISSQGPVWTSSSPICS